MKNLMRISKWSLRQKLVVLNILTIFPVAGILLGYAIPLFESRFMQDRIDINQANVEVAVSGIQAIYDQSQKHEITEEEAKKRALQQVRSLRYGSSGYFWIHDLDSRMVMHPMKPALEGVDQSQSKDSNGKFFFVEMTKVAVAKGEGVVDYLWPKPGSDTPVLKVSYVKLFKPWGWVVGSGTYVDDVHGATLQFKIHLLLSVFTAFGLSALGFHLFSTRLSKTLTATIASVEEISSTVNQLSHKLESTGQTLSNSVSQAATSIQETSASLEQIGAMAQNSAKSSENSKQSAEQSRSTAETGQRTVQEMIESMGGIHKSSEDILGYIAESNRRISEIIKVIQEIDQKTKIINDIVFQTKLLSFNASVEAARAGEHGKGFAVVAEEVGNLAQMSGRAAQEISTMLSQSIHKVDSIVTDTQRGVEGLIAGSKSKVQDGTQVVQRCLEVFNHILDSAQGVAQEVNGINRACQEQAQGVAEINKAIQQLSEATQTNANSSNLVAESSTQLSRQARVLEDLTLRLRVLVQGPVDSDSDRAAA